MLIGALALLVIGLFVAGFIWYESSQGSGAKGPQVIVTVLRGDSVGSVSADLSSKKIIGSKLAWRIYLLVHGTPIVEPGGYLLHKNESFAAIDASLRSGPDVFPVTVLEGTTVAELASQIGQYPGHDASAFERAANDGSVRSPFAEPGSTSLDGLLGLGTYLVLPGESNHAVLESMVASFDVEATKIGLSAGASALSLTPYQAVTVASIVQKEAIAPGDSASATSYNVGRVARVIYNRLAAGIDLQDDSTVLFAERRDGGPVTPADLAIQSPYNTYLHTGLTPTPICFPSLEAFEGALHPVPGSWMYFQLTSRDGTETFSLTLAQQLAAEALARKRGLP